MLTKVQRQADPDETEGRKLYRGHADALAKAQINLARRKVRYVRAAAALEKSDAP